MNIAILASGTGTTLQTLIDQQRQHGYRVALVVTNRECQAQIRAENHCIPTLCSKDWQEIDKAFANHAIQLIVLAGFLAIVPQWICEKWKMQIINVHPSLLPKYGGKGMYGLRVHEAVLTSGDTESGITIHHVNEHYDQGAIILQAKCPVLPDDTPDTLASRVHQLEYEHFPVAIENLL